MNFQLFSNCIIVEGVKDDAIYDLHAGNFMKIKKRISKLLQKDFLENTIDEMYALYPNWIEGLNRYMDKLIEKEVAFKTKDAYKFPALDLSYASPFRLNNAVIHVNQSMDYVSSINQILLLGAQGFQLIFDNPTVQDLQKYVDLFVGSRARKVDIFITKSELSYEMLEGLKDDRRFVYTLFDINEAQKGDFDKLPKLSQSRYHYFFKETALDLCQEESYGEEYFTISIQHFIEAQERNIGLNKKVCIDYQGYIKNFINHEKSFGNIKEDKITDVVNTEAFQKLWFIDNSQIEKCKGCIYRMMCFSCSDILVEEGKYFKKDDCHYDPNSDIWSENPYNQNSALSEP